MQAIREYRLEIKQIVDYPRCRMYRGFVQNLIAHRSIRTNGNSGLFHYVALCTYANFRTSYRRLDGISYTVFPGAWICRVTELMGYLRLRSKRQVFSVLNGLQERGLVKYTILRGGAIISYSIVDWARSNTILEYNCPCQKETGFFFIPVATVMELVSFGRCSEMDMLLDLWISAIYNDDQVQGSKQGPVAYFRNGTGSPLVSYSELSARWNVSKATVCRALKKLSQLGHISLLTFPGRHGTVIYLQNYLSIMFQIADGMIDKAEVALCLNIKIKLPVERERCRCDSVSEFPTVSQEDIIVSNQAADGILRNVLKALEIHGLSRLSCERFRYKLYPLYDCKGMLEDQTLKRYRLNVYCTGQAAYSFDLTISKARCGHGG